ncbi:hypothetical protein PX554_19705 [Sphingomonas sp. H39-1-10]|uniref:hypothetical protein n=1 Tax=Sphingomonas pollutisoli TaxID=3030829 RepID=UPI0023B8F68E|nr:hypothetical protein [Sphingomonas pollutisoli]MDF0490357.1 hypothetical protein [Sphingomonas pollutisoli]
MAAPTFDTFEPERSGAVQRVLPWAIGAALLAALAWFVWTQLNAVGGVAVPAPSAQQISMLPPPPPPPPPPPEPKEKPPEPTEQPQPSPVEAPKTPQQQAAPVTIAGPAQAGTDAYGVQSGSGAGGGAPGSTGTCLVNCGAAPGGGGMSEGFYRRYLSSELQSRIDGDDRFNRLVFDAEVLLTVTPEGRVTGARLASGSDSETVRRLSAALNEMRLNAPPASMVFPYRLRLRGRKPGM